jgi:hypothetical protein
LVTSSSPNLKKKQPRTSLNPFARFCHPEKENRRDVRFVKPSFDPKTGKRLPLPPVPKRQQDSKQHAIPATVTQSQQLPEEDVDTDATDTSSVSSPPSTKAAKSSYFGGGRKYVRKVTAEELDNDSDDVVTTPPTLEAGGRSMHTTVDEAAVGVPLVAAHPTAPVPPEDFYDEWLSPQKPALEEIHDSDDDSPLPPPRPVASARANKPGVVRYSLGGSKRTFSDKSRSLLTKKAYQRKPVKRPPGTLFDHFRLAKRSTKG